MPVIFTNEFQVDFELTGELGVTTVGDQKKEWNQKLCDYTFWHQKTREIIQGTLESGIRSFR